MEDALPIKKEEEDVQMPKAEDAALPLSQLLFTVGHIGIKQIVHLELCEMDFKRRKMDKEKQAAVAPTPVKKGKGSKKDAKDVKEEDQDDLDLITAQPRTISRMLSLMSVRESCSMVLNRCWQTLARWSARFA
jgi:condensin complex subunit 1